MPTLLARKPAAPPSPTPPAPEPPLPPPRPWDDPRARALATVVAAASLGGLAALVFPRGPVTTASALTLLALGLAIGLAAGALLRSRWAMLLAALGFAAAFELRWIPLESPVLDPPRFDTAYGILAALLGRGFFFLVAIVPMLVGVALGAAYARGRPERVSAWRWARRVLTAAATLGVAALAVALALPASTPPVPGGLAALEQIELGGEEQWISVRGASPDNPVLLYLSGGPGQTDMPQVRAWWRDFEEDFTIVNWDELGVGKSYPALGPGEEVTLDRIVSDAIELAEKMRDRFGQDKIYLVGESWGSFLGVLVARERPDLFHAYVGSGQMVDILETDTRLYEDMLAYAERTGDEAAAERMRGYGPPPYDDPFANAYVMTYYEELAGEYDFLPYLEERAAEVNPGPWGIFGSEYTLVEKVNVLRGLVDYFTVVYPQAQGIDLREEASRLEVPVYLVQGRHELDARTDLARSWFAGLEAPRKRFEWFENAGHATAFEEFRRFHDLMTETVLAETYRR